MDNDVRDGLAFEPVVDNADKGTLAEPDETQNTQPDQTPETPAFDPQTAYKGLEEQLRNFQRELGQSRTMQSKLDKLLAMQERGSQPKQNSQDDVFKKYSPEVISESEALITALWEKKYGEQFKGLQSFQTEAQTERVVNQFDSSARSFAGKDYDSLQSPMQNIVQAARQAASQGDDEAREFIQLMTTSPRAGARLLVSLAKESMTGQAGAQNAQANQQLQAKGAKIAGATPGGSTKSQGKKDPSTMTLAELRAAAEAEAIGS